MKGTISLPRTFGRAQKRGDETTRTVEHDDGLKAVFVVMRIEQTKLLAAMHGVERVVDVQHDPFRHLLERGAIEIDHGAPHAEQCAGIRQVFQPGDRRLRTEVAIGWRKVEGHLEERIATQTAGVVAVLVARGDHQQAERDDVGQAMGDLIGRARVFDAGRETLGHLQVLLDFA